MKESLQSRARILKDTCIILLFLFAPGYTQAQTQFNSQVAVEGNIGSFQLGKNYLSLFDIKGNDKKERIKGTRFFPADFGKSILVDVHGNNIVNPAYTLIYDKVTAKVYLKQTLSTDTTILQLTNDSLQSFAVEDEYGKLHNFVRVENKQLKKQGSSFFEVLYNDNRIRLLKFVSTKFIKANNQTGHQGQLHDEAYDEYKDEVFYYLENPDSNITRIKFSVKSISNVFGKKYATVFSEKVESNPENNEQVLLEIIDLFCQNKKQE